MEVPLTPPSFLTSPIVEIVVGEGEHETVLKAHQALLIQSPFLSERVQKLETSGPVSNPRLNPVKTVLTLPRAGTSDASSSPPIMSRR